MAIDHLVWAVPNLWDGIVTCAELLGVRPVPGGSHPRWGTHNALLGLGSGCYLEIIAPDPAASVKPAIFGLGEAGRRSPRRLAGWALRVQDIERSARDAADHDITLGAVSDGRRERPDGAALSWRMTDPSAVPEHGIIPFLIQWTGSQHPSMDAPTGCHLTDLAVEHPDPASIRSVLGVLGARVSVTRAPQAALVARIRSPAGIIELR